MKASFLTMGILCAAISSRAAETPQPRLVGIAEFGGKQVALMESGLLTSRTDALGGAEIQGLVKDMAVSKGMVFRRSDLLPVKNISPEYSKISTRIEVHGNIHQLVDFLVSLGSSPTILFVEEMRISPAQMGDLKNKQVVSTLLISGLKTPDKGNSASDKKS